MQPQTLPNHPSPPPDFPTGGLTDPKDTTLSGKSTSSNGSYHVYALPGQLATPYGTEEIPRGVLAEYYEFADDVTQKSSEPHYEMETATFRVYDQPSGTRTATLASGRPSDVGTATLASDQLTDSGTATLASDQLTDSGTATLASQYEIPVVMEREVCVHVCAVATAL